jgi:hypothetical protein
MAEINLGIDRNRIKEVLREAYTTCKDVLGTDFNITLEEFISKIDLYLNSNRVSIAIQINLPSQKYPELIIEVDLRRKSVIARMTNRNKRIELNRYLTCL